MTSWINVISANELPEGEYTTLELPDTELLIIKSEGDVYAVENLCSHQSFELAGGEIENSEITCPLHEARFCLKTGKALCEPAEEKIKTYPVRIHEQIIQVFNRPIE
ncbi:non-heme iron oxygenase ferredoxin subunit [Vibrio sp. Of7-15]|uniref:Rieske (2Fe-2S) protein n=1 Tax=Vibrio sp. Of7-15 TaxID=2724879 RepID=UPI001EF2CDBB|nr:non-heme iron oxygenase ferredoxin subunit [Vibrio sp. Of7-15]MCG7495478.1 non-heme iron oxygenase ferredoxin subunit [Vibrio sp. Of7-15]